MFDRSHVTKSAGFSPEPIGRQLNAPTPRFQLTYAVTPPNQTTPFERRQAIAAAQSARIVNMPVDAVLVYDLQDETSRNANTRPFPFIPKVDALTYAFDELRVGDLPRVVYRAIADQGEASLQRWLARLQAQGAYAVFVGAPSSNRATTLTLPQAFSVCRNHTPIVPFGGVLIAERHQTTAAEDIRVYDKINHGCAFFVSQTTWSVDATISLLRDLKKRTDSTRVPVPNILLTLSPCGSEQTLRFQEWLGVHVPASTKRQLLQASDMLSRSVELAVEVFATVRTFALMQGLTIGCNVESVSTRSDEVEASIELVRRIAELQATPAPRRVETAV